MRKRGLAFWITFLLVMGYWVGVSFAGTPSAVLSCTSSDSFIPWPVKGFAACVLTGGTAYFNCGAAATTSMAPLPTCPAGVSWGTSTPCDTAHCISGSTATVYLYGGN